MQVVDDKNEKMACNIRLLKKTDSTYLNIISDSKDSNRQLHHLMSLL